MKKAKSITNEVPRKLTVGELENYIFDRLESQQRKEVAEILENSPFYQTVLEGLEIKFADKYRLHKVSESKFRKSLYNVDPDIKADKSARAHTNKLAVS